MTFTDDLLEETKLSESPKSYWYWCALCTIAAVKRREVWFDKGFYKLYPNMYVILVGPSGIRKGLPVVTSVKLAKLAGLKGIIEGRASIQAIISDLAKVRTSENGGPPTRNSTGYIVNDEFSTALVRDQDSLTILTKLYDGHFTDEWTNNLKSSPNEKMVEVCINLFGAMNEKHFNDVISSKEIEGGFVGRTSLVLEHRRARKSSLVGKGRVPPPINYEKLSKYLKVLMTLKGPMELTDEADEVYNDWYYKFDPEKMADKTGTGNRIHDTILKVAMNISMSRSPDLKIDGCDVVEAIEACGSTTASVDKITLSRGDQEFAAKQKLFIAALLSKEPDYTDTKSALLSTNLGGFDHLDIDRIAENLELAGLIVSGSVRKNSRTEITYTLTAKLLKIVEGKLKEEKK